MGPLTSKATNAEIMEFFKEFNPVTCKIINKGYGNRFSFIYFHNEIDRDNAIEAKNHQLFKGAEVVVNQSFNAYSGEYLGGRKKKYYYDDFDWF